MGKVLVKQPKKKGGAVAKKAKKKAVGRKGKKGGRAASSATERGWTCVERSGDTWWLNNCTQWVPRCGLRHTLFCCCCCCWLSLLIIWVLWCRAWIQCELRGNCIESQSESTCRLSFHSLSRVLHQNKTSTHPYLIQLTSKDSYLNRTEKHFENSKYHFENINATTTKQQKLEPQVSNGIMDVHQKHRCRQIIVAHEVHVKAFTDATKGQTMSTIFSENRNKYVSACPTKRPHNFTIISTSHPRTPKPDTWDSNFYEVSGGKEVSMNLFHVVSPGSLNFQVNNEKLKKRLKVTLVVILTTYLSLRVTHSIRFICAPTRFPGNRLFSCIWRLQHDHNTEMLN